MSDKSKLPTIQELTQDVEVAFKNDQLNLLLNQPPPEKWIKDHPFAKKVKYIPIDKVELMMTKLFQIWRVEVKEVGQIFNSVYVSVRVHYLHPIYQQMHFQDGVGAVGVQTEKGAAAADMGAIKSDAIMKALPAAKSYAIKDACEHLGRIFGRDLNRPDAVGYTASYIDPEQQHEELTELFELKRESMREDDINAVERILKNKEINSYNKLKIKLQSL